MHTRDTPKRAESANLSGRQAISAGMAGLRGITANVAERSAVLNLLLGKRDGAFSSATASPAPPGQTARVAAAELPRAPAAQPRRASAAHARRSTELRHRDPHRGGPDVARPPGPDVRHQVRRIGAAGTSPPSSARGNEWKPAYSITITGGFLFSLLLRAGSSCQGCVCRERMRRRLQRVAARRRRPV
jgi:hypothetical protein